MRESILVEILARVRTQAMQHLQRYGTRLGKGRSARAASQASPPPPRRRRRLIACHAASEVDEDVGPDVVWLDEPKCRIIFSWHPDDHTGSATIVIRFFGGVHREPLLRAPVTLNTRSVRWGERQQITE